MQHVTASRVLRLFMTAIFLTSCASSTIINTEPQGAQVFVDGALRGTTPFTYTDRKTIGSTTSLLIKKEGYEEFQSLMVRNEEFDPAACAGGIFLLVPFLWIQKYSPERTFELTSIEGGADEVVEAVPQATPQTSTTPEPTPATSNKNAKADKSKRTRTKVPAPPPPKSKTN
jgi:hypothetical protein